MVHSFFSFLDTFKFAFLWICQNVLNALITTSVQFSSVAQLCPTLCDLMNHSTPSLLVPSSTPGVATNKLIYFKKHRVIIYQFQKKVPDLTGNISYWRRWTLKQIVLGKKNCVPLKNNLWLLFPFYDILMPFISSIFFCSFLVLCVTNAIQMGL